MSVIIEDDGTWFDDMTEGPRPDHIVDADEMIDTYNDRIRGNDAGNMPTT